MILFKKELHYLTQKLYIYLLQKKNTWTDYYNNIYLLSMFVKCYMLVNRLMINYDIFVCKN
jgi:hypothetical protein